MVRRHLRATRSASATLSCVATAAVWRHRTRAPPRHVRRLRLPPPRRQQRALHSLGTISLHARCRRLRLLRGTNGQSLVRAELKARLAALTCPGADNKAAKPILDATSTNAGR